MRALHLFVSAALVLTLAGCGSGQEDVTMPDVVGSKLDLAESDIKRAGYTGSVEVIGGGLFGILDESNWKVCDQLPTAGEVVTSKPRLTVERICETGDDSAGLEPEGEAESTSPSSPSADSSVDAEAMEQKFLTHLENNFIDSIDSMCDPEYTHWACFYDGVEGQPSFLQVNLTTDGGWSAVELEQMADQAGHHWFNFIGCDFPDLGTIVVRVNGLDHNVLRSSTLVKC